MLSSIGDVKDVVDSYESHTVIIGVLVLGCVIFVISFLGCCGAIRENTCCTMTVSSKNRVKYTVQQYGSLYKKIVRMKIISIVRRSGSQLGHIWPIMIPHMLLPLLRVVLFACCIIRFQPLTHLYEISRGFPTEIFFFLFLIHTQ